jgi:hypothetical protein
MDVSFEKMIVYRSIRKRLDYPIQAMNVRFNSFLFKKQKLETLKTHLNLSL